MVCFTIPIGLRTFAVRGKFRPGPWHLGKFSTLSGCVAVSFTSIMVPILNLPSVSGADLTPDLMNWTCVVYFGPVLLSKYLIINHQHWRLNNADDTVHLVMIWWFVSARKWFTGPKVNVDHLMMGDGQNVIDGDQGKNAVDHESSSDNGIAVKKGIEN